MASPRGGSISVQESRGVLRPRPRQNGSGGNGPVRVADRIVDFADQILGDRVEPVLVVHTQAGDGRFRGVRRSASWDASDPIGDDNRICGRISIGGRTPGRMLRASPRSAVA